MRNLCLFLLFVLIRNFNAYSAQFYEPGTFGFYPSDIGITKISRDGTTIVGSELYPVAGAGVGSTGFRWRVGDTMLNTIDLPTSFAPPSRGLDVSDDGKTILASAYHTVTEGQSFLWKEDAAGNISQALLPFTGNADNLGRAISGDGRVVVGRSKLLTGQPALYYWNDTLGPLSAIPIGSAGAGGSTSIESINQDGSILVGTNYTMNPLPPFQDLTEAVGYLVGGGWHHYGSLGPYHLSESHDINGNGTIVVGHTNTNTHTRGFVMNRVTGQMKAISAAGGSWASEAWGVSENGEVIVGRIFEASGVGLSFAALWQCNHMTGKYKRNLIAQMLVNQGAIFAYGNWNLTHALDISGDGTRIVGKGFNQSSQTNQVWVAELTVPTLPGPLSCY